MNQTGGGLTYVRYVVDSNWKSCSFWGNEGFQRWVETHSRKLRVPL